MTQIKIFTTTTCPYCKMQKEYLDSRGVAYQTVVVDEDQDAFQELMGLSGQFGVPFTVFTKEDGTKETLLGFDKEAIDKILNLS